MNSNYFCSKRCGKAYEAEKFQLFKHNNRCHHHKFERLTYRNECWLCYIGTFENKVKPRFKKQIRLKLFNGFRLIPTFRTSKNSWKGDKIAFESYLEYNNVKWFVYIKYYEDKYGRAIPIVVGKSGSLKVNSSGSDLSFSTAVEDGSTRRFLKENKLDWHYDHISIRECPSQWSAFKVEDKIRRKFKLNGS